MKSDIQCIWFKKNLRIQDNQVFEKIDSGIATIWFFLLEDEIITQADFSYFHLKFIVESLLELQKNLAALNIQLVVCRSNFEDFILKLEQNYTIKKIVSTQETGNMATYKRDTRVIKFLKNEDISFLEVVNNGVVRALKNRNNWSKIWNQRMWENIFHEKIFTKIPEIINFPKSKTIEILDYYHNKTKHFNTQIWWETQALKILDWFLSARVQKYSFDIWKPFDSTKSCSRLSPYITYGNISIKKIYHESLKKIEELKYLDTNFAKKYISQIDFFLARIHWQSHFIQKLESQPEIEFKNLYQKFDQIRNQADQKIIDDFFNAKTGIPYIDACMICLKNTGWINFRSRACMVSYICNTMLQPWQSISHKLACLFTDYEPGIHYSQIQMQAGTTGINTIRMYNPIKQSQQKDPYGLFIKKWIPIFKNIDIKYIHEPWLSPEKIPWYEKVIDIASLNKYAKDLIWWIKNDDKKSQVLKKIYEKHGSRKKTQKPKKVSQKNINQLTIF